MTRFAGSSVDFTPMSLQSAGAGGGYGAAGENVDLASTYAAQRDKAPKFDALAQQGIANRSQERQASMQASADVMGAGLTAVGNTKAAALTAEGTIKAAQAQADAAKMGSMMEGIGSIASAAIPLLSDESTKTAITPIDSALAKLRELKPVTFYYKSEYGDHTRMHHGFVAQDYKKVMPDATYVDKETGKMCIDTVDLIGLLVRANQELESRVTRMEAKLVLQAV